MNDLLRFALASVALLAAPGPTNVLMAAAGMQRGLAGAVPLAGAALAGYFIAITVWIELVGAVAATQPMVPVIAKLVAAAFLLWSAWRLWVNAGHPDLAQRGITLGRVFTTTLINPKALVFAFAIFPPIGFVARLPHMGIFAGLVIGTAVGWMVLGTLAMRSSAGRLTSSRIERMTAMALAVFATLLVAQTMQGALAA